MHAETAESPSRRLKAATAVLHQRVEDGVALLDRTASREGYVDLLQRMEAFYRPFEPMLEGLLQNHLPGGFLLSRLPRIRADLQTLGAAPNREDAALPVFSSRAEAMGGLYVVEGAALGGQVIARHLARAHGLTPEHGASFFASEGTPVGPRWRAVRELLDGESDVEALERGATATFLAFEKAVVHG